MGFGSSQNGKQLELRFMVKREALAKRVKLEYS